MSSAPIRLTTYSHGSGCGCKISPRILDEILRDQKVKPDNARLLVGNDARDDAAAYDLGDGNALLSTTDFFMPIVDDAFDFGRIAAANAISDIYAMGGRPFLALAILGWPVDNLGPEIAREVIAGARSLCSEAGVTIAGGHSIDSPEPIFGLSVNGTVRLEYLKRNSGARPGDLLFLTKPLGVGILTTAEKKGLLRDQDHGVAARSMLRLNKIGAEVAPLAGVHAVTDVTGFGLLGHLMELCESGDVSARLRFSSIPLLTDLGYYLERRCVPGGTARNFDSYGHGVSSMSDSVREVLCDPQTSGGLLMAVDPRAVSEIRDLFAANDLGEIAEPIGEITERDGPAIHVA